MTASARDQVMDRCARVLRGICCSLLLVVAQACSLAYLVTRDPVRGSVTRVRGGAPVRNEPVVVALSRSLRGGCQAGVEERSVVRTDAKGEWEVATSSQLGWVIALPDANLGWCQLYSVRGAAPLLPKAHRQKMQVAMDGLVLTVEETQPILPRWLPVFGLLRSSDQVAAAYGGVLFFPGERQTSLGVRLQVQPGISGVSAALGVSALWFQRTKSRLIMPAGMDLSARVVRGYDRDSHVLLGPELGVSFLLLRFSGSAGFDLQKGPLTPSFRWSVGLSFL